jgi:hypothetical protein
VCAAAYWAQGLACCYFCHRVTNFTVSLRVPCFIVQFLCTRSAHAVCSTLLLVN